MLCAKRFVLVFSLEQLHWESATKHVKLYASVCFYVCVRGKVNECVVHVVLRV